MKKFFGSCARFMKRNIYYVLLAVCILIIGTLVTIAVINENKTVPVINENPQDQTPGGDDGSGDNTEDPTVNTDPIIFQMPLGEYTLGMEHSGDNLIFNATLKQFQTHNGIDFKAEAGSDVFAVYDGTVESITNDVLNGTVVVINDDLKTTYRSLGSELNIKVGDKVRSGDVIGKVSDSAFSEILEGAHIHLEVSYKGESVDPADYLPFDNK